MDDLFKKRMDNIGIVGEKIVDRTNAIIRKTFQNDQNYQCGTLYDWNMNPLEENVEFKFEKHKTYSAEGNEVEYYVHFMPEYNPESLFKDAYYRQDGKERLGFYIEVMDRTKGESDLWLIIGKDDRVAMDRYLALKCNWQLEWLDSDRRWHSSTIVVRDSIADNVREWETTTSMQGTNVGGIVSAIMPTSFAVKTLTFGMRVMITDNELTPRCFEVSDMKDASPLGVTKLYLSRSKFNAHTDYCGQINDRNQNLFKAVNKIGDLPEKLGRDLHCLCDCMDGSQILNPPTPESKKPMIQCKTDVLFINGAPAIIKALPEDHPVEWHYYVDNQEYSKEDLEQYFLIDDSVQNQLSIKATNRVMAQYIFKAAVFDENHSYYSSHELEVKI